MEKTPNDVFNSTAVGEFVEVSKCLEWEGGLRVIRPGAVSRYYPNENCRRVMLFEEYQSPRSAAPNGEVLEYLFAFRCKHCEQTRFYMAVLCVPDKKSMTAGELVKIAEWPVLRPPISERLSAIAGEDRGLLQKGMRAESLGLGVGAAAYYRRIVERIKDRLFDEIITVCVQLGGHDALVLELQQAKGQTQFLNAIKAIRQAIPESLRLPGGHNPLTLLHTALSENIHTESDAECLANAAAIREILGHLANRLDQALKAHQGLNESVKVLLDKRNQRALTGKSPS